MKANKRIIAFAVLTLALLVAIAFAIVSIKGNKSKEVKVAKSFVEKLQKMDMINLYQSVDDIEFKSITDVVNKNSINQYTVIGDNITVDLDAKYNVIGFSQKVKEGRAINENIDVENAKVLAEKYVDEIISGKFAFKQVIAEKEGEEVSDNYSIAFYKFVKEYPYYDNEIVVNINKNTGKLQNYSNQTISKVKHNLKKNISIEECKENAIDYYNELNIKVEIAKEPLLAVTIRADGDFELTYVVDLSIVGLDGKVDKNKIFINAETGEVVNRTTDLIEASKSK